MNERINGLWWKARIGYNNQSCDPEVLEKFALLIVRECADVATINAHQWASPGTYVLKHFGVEE
jgi:hypothetical protein